MSKSQIFLFFCLSFIVGVFIQSLINLPQLFWLGILVLGIMAAAVFWGKWKLAVVGFCLMLVFLGAWRFEQHDSRPNSVKRFNDKEKIILLGKIIEEPDKRSDKINYKIKTMSYRLNNEVSPIQGNVLLAAKKYPAYQYGDILEIDGKLKTPRSSEDFDYAKYLAKDDIYSIVYYPAVKVLNQGQGSWLLEKLFFVKNKFENSLNQILIEPQASFLAGLILGERRGLPADLTAAFSRTGTSHLVALSGYNITIVALALMNLFNFFLVRRRISFWISAAAILLFVLMTGASASAARAGIMGILVLVAQQSSRLYQIRNALVLAGALMVCFNPKVLVFDLGFQLSFAATLGLVYLAPIFQDWWGKKSAEGLPTKSFFGWREILFATLAAQLAVLPLLVINFGQLSLIAPLANLLIILFIPATMFWGFLAGAAGIFWLGLGKILSWPVWLFLTYEIKVAEILARVPLAAVSFEWQWWGGVVYYAVLVWLIRRFNERNKKSPLSEGL